jgi:esterase/lipase superfamily enzyme
MEGNDETQRGSPVGSNALTPLEVRNFFTPPVGDIVILKLRALRSYTTEGSVDDAPFPDRGRLLTNVRLSRLPTSEFPVNAASQVVLATRVEVFPCEEYLFLDLEDGPELAFDVGLLLERTPLAEALAVVIADAHALLTQQNGLESMAVEVRDDTRAFLLATIPLSTPLSPEDVIASAPLIRSLRFTRRQDDGGGHAIAEGLDAETETPRYDVATLPILEQTRRLVGKLRHDVLPVYFCTDRDFSAPSSRISRGADLTYGVAAVGIPDNHRPGRIEKPLRPLASYEWARNPNRHIVVLREKLCSPADCFGDLAQAMRRTTKADILVFVHGFRTTFEEGLCRVAQIVNDLQYAGVPFLFSWPSQGDVKAYVEDVEAADWAAEHLKYCVEALAAQAHADAIHVVAHSMGSRVLLGALEKFAAKGARIFGECVLTAPDFDQERFHQMVARIHTTSERMSLYVSERDWAMRAAQWIRPQGRRLGDARNFYCRPDLLDTIDATPIAAVLSDNHFYSATHPRALQELRELLEFHLPAPKRWCIEPRKDCGYQFKIPRERK